jgi:hypothetical protein
MNAALDLLEQARRYGVEIRAKGDKLKLKAPKAPPPDLLERLRASKPAILAALSEPAPAWSADNWRVFFDERAGIAEFDGGLSRQEAEALAYETCLMHWVNTSPPDHAKDGTCPCCGKEIIGNAGIPVLRPPGGNIWLHEGCHSRWLLRRRTEAKKTLIAMSINPPARCS